MEFESLRLFRSRRRGKVIGQSAADLNDLFRENCHSCVATEAWGVSEGVPGVEEFNLIKGIC